MWETIQTEHLDGFEIVFSVTPEDMPPDWDETDEQKAETLRNIENGTWAYFVARVEAKKRGIVLGVDYLGGCCYDSPQKFVEAGDYYKSMVDTAIAEARDIIKKL